MFDKIVEGLGLTVAREGKSYMASNGDVFLVQDGSVYQVKDFTYLCDLDQYISIRAGSVPVDQALRFINDSYADNVYGRDRLYSDFLEFIKNGLKSGKDLSPWYSVFESLVAQYGDKRFSTLADLVA